MESDGLLPCSNIKLEPVLSWASNITKLEPNFGVEKDNSVKLEPVAEADCVYSSAKESLPEIEISDEMENEIPACLKTQQPEVYIDYPGQDILALSESYPSTYLKEHSQMGMYGNNEFMKKELPDILNENRRFSRMEDMTGIIQAKEAHVNLKRTLTKNSCKASVNHEIGQVSENMFSVINIKEKLSMTNKRCQLQNVDTQMKQTQHLQESLVLVTTDGLKWQLQTRTGKKPYTCDECGASFFQAANLKFHMRTHTGEKPYKCDQCGACFVQVVILERHMKTHTGEKRYKCDECGVCFAKGQHLNCHQRTHTGEKPYRCDVCHACFVHTASLKYHMRTHAGEKRYKCDECGACFVQNSNLKTHKRTHTGEKPFKCDECGASFGQAASLNYHMRIHTGEKPFKCDECGTFFSRSYNLKSHKRIHTGEKSFMCDECGIFFSRRHILKSHKRTHTGEKPECG